MRFRGLVFSALFAALFAVLSLVQFHVSVIPITLETLVVMLTGALLGPWYGGLTYLIVVGLDLLGLPLIDGGGGVGTLIGPTAGFIWGWPVCAWLTGFAVRAVKINRRGEYLLLFLSLFILGDILCYIPGVLWLRHVDAAVRPWGKALMAGAIPFLPGDVVKALVAAVIVMRVRRVYPQERIIRGEAFVGGAGAGETSRMG